MHVSPHAVWITVRSLVLIGTGVYAGLTLLLSMTQSNLVYHPRKSVDATPKQIGLPFKNITFPACDGTRLNGWWVPAADAKWIVLFCHGNTGNIGNRLEIINIIHRLGMSMFLFDYRGYGNSEGTPDEQGTYDDARAAFDWILKTQKCTPTDIIVFGRSLGGAVASHLASTVNPRALVLESSFTSITELGSRMHPFLPVRLMARYSYPTLEHVRKVQCPVLVVHSPEDNLVPYEHGRRLFDAVTGPKTFLEITGGHNKGFLTTGERYVAGLGSFFDSLGSGASGNG